MKAAHDYLQQHAALQQHTALQHEHVVQHSSALRTPLLQCEFAVCKVKHISTVCLPLKYGLSASHMTLFAHERHKCLFTLTNGKSIVKKLEELETVPMQCSLSTLTMVHEHELGKLCSGNFHLCSCGGL